MFGLPNVDEDDGNYELIHEPDHPLKEVTDIHIFQ